MYNEYAIFKVHLTYTSFRLLFSLVLLDKTETIYHPLFVKSTKKQIHIIDCVRQICLALYIQQYVKINISENIESVVIEESLLVCHSL